eukprot:GHVL01031369.1.p1 GENE.GHVL01031369.1~~GHVL01031369.1.p1  ORF type:complete len:506 (-),score=72.40 GHVL01031369.1:411-1928(-)
MNISNSAPSSCLHNDLSQLMLIFRHSYAAGIACCSVLESTNHQLMSAYEYLSVLQSIDEERVNKAVDQEQIPESTSTVGVVRMDDLVALLSKAEKAVTLVESDNRSRVRKKTDSSLGVSKTIQMLKATEEAEKKIIQKPVKIEAEAKPTFDGQKISKLRLLRNRQQQLRDSVKECNFKIFDNEVVQSKNKIMRDGNNTLKMFYFHRKLIETLTHDGCDINHSNDFTVNENSTRFKFLKSLNSNSEYGSRAGAVVTSWLKFLLLITVNQLAANYCKYPTNVLLKIMKNSNNSKIRSLQQLIRWLKYVSQTCLGSNLKTIKLWMNDMSVIKQTLNKPQTNTTLVSNLKNNKIYSPWWIDHLFEIPLGEPPWCEDSNYPEGLRNIMKKLKKISYLMIVENCIDPVNISENRLKNISAIVHQLQNQTWKSVVLVHCKKLLNSALIEITKHPSLPKDSLSENPASSRILHLVSIYRAVFYIISLLRPPKTSSSNKPPRHFPTVIYAPSHL